VKYTIAIYDEEPIACEGDDLAYESMVVIADSQAEALTSVRQNYPTSYLFLWSVEQ
jgi:hypothetical protein